MSSKPPLVPERAAAEAELRALVAEMPSWEDDMLLYMYARFGTSRLFRVRHDLGNEMTPRAQALRQAAAEEIARRGLALPEPSASEE